MVTIKDVAKQAGVSVATVSRVLNKDKVVKKDTVEKVISAIEKTGYTPNLLGRQLRKSRTDKILALIPSISNQFYSKIISAMEKVARNRGYTLMISMSHGDLKIERIHMEMAASRSIDGIIFFSSEINREEMDKFSASFPVVQCCEYIEGSKTDIVSIDNKKAAYDAVCYLVEKGYKKIAFFGVKEKYYSAYLRELGYSKALSEMGIELTEEYIFHEGYSYPDGAAMAKKIIATDSGKRPDAIFCISDSIAMGAIKTFDSAGMNIPGDIAIMGFDNTSVSKIFCPAISTVSQPQKDIGETAMKLIIQRMENRAGEHKKIILPHELVIRETA